jgi:hypothetical protein
MTDMEAMERDHIDENPQHKSLAAFFVAWAIGCSAYFAPMPLWGTALVTVVVWLGLHKVAGLKLRWSYPEW